MPASNVRLSPPLIRQKPFYPGQFGVAGSDVSLGERLSTTGKIIYVDPNYIGVTDDGDGTDPECPVATIQAALARCTSFAGDMIVVGANDDWQYGPRSTARNIAIEEDVIVNVHGVAIIGIAPSSPIGVIWRPATDGGTACTVNAVDVLIEGFAFCRSHAVVLGVGGRGIYAFWNGTTRWGDSLVVRNCFFGDNIDTAIQLEYSWNTYIEDCEFQDVDLVGIYSDPAGSDAGFCVIRRNWFHEVGVGQMGAIRFVQTHDNLIADNWIYNHEAQDGVAVPLEGINTSGGTQNTVAGNVLSCVLADFGAFCDSAATDAWIQNMCMNGPTVTNP